MPAGDEHPLHGGSDAPVGRKNSIHRPFLLPGRVKDSRQVEDGRGVSMIGIGIRRGISSVTGTAGMAKRLIGACEDSG